MYYLLWSVQMIIMLLAGAREHQLQLSALLVTSVTALWQRRQCYVALQVVHVSLEVVRVSLGLVLVRERRVGSLQVLM